MRNFDYSKLKERTWDNEILSLVSKIHEYKGKNENYLKSNPVELDRLIEVAKVQSTEASNRIEGIVTTSTRLKQIMLEKTSPKNRDESEILGYRNVLNMIHENYEYIDVTPNYILQLFSEMLKYTSLSYAGKFKTTSNVITKTLEDGKEDILFIPLEPYETPEAVEKICNEYKKIINEESVDPLIIIPCFILDFLCIHPVNDGNGRLSRLLTTLLLYKNGYMVGKYISIEKEIAETKEEYYKALELSNRYWLEESNDPKEFIKYMLKIILACYKELDKRLELVNNDGIKSSSYDIVKKYVLSTIGLFTKTDVLENCIGISRSSVLSALKKLMDENVIACKGQGKSTKYYLKQK